MSNDSTYEFMARNFPENEQVIQNYKKDVLKLPPVLAEESVETKYKGKNYHLNLKLLRPYSEHSIASPLPGQKTGLFPLSHDSMYTQAWAYNNKQFIHGWMIKIQQDGNKIETDWVLAAIADHEPLAGCMLFAGYDEQEINDLFENGARIPFNDPSLEARLLLSIDGDIKKKDVQYFPWRRSKYDVRVAKLVDIKLSNLIEATHGKIANFVYRNTEIDIRNKKSDYDEMYFPVHSEKLT